jgi:tetratricopeptide (TPR) repeat protein
MVVAFFRGTDIRRMSVTPPFRLRTLGTLRLVGADGAEEPSLATRRRKLALLALLAVSGRPMSRDRLVDLFWGDHPEERARHSLSDALSHLRRVLGPEAITARHAEVELAEGIPLTVDLRELAAAATAQEWARVIALYDGPFLDGVHIGGSPEWEHWVTAQRTGALRLFLTACRAEAERFAEASDWRALEHVTSRWMEVAPDDPALARFRRTAITHLDAAPESTPASTPDTTPADAGRATYDGPARVAPPVPSARTRAPWLRRPLAIGALVATMSLVAVTAMRWDRMDPDATFTFTTRSVEALALIERASLGADGGVSRTESIALLEQAIALDSGFAMAYRTLALLHAGDQTKNAEVARLLTMAASVADRVTPFERSLVMSSYHLLVTGDFARAAAAQRTLIRLAPHDGDAWHDLGMTYQYLGDDRRAAEAYRASLARDRSSASTWSNLLDALVSTDDRVAVDAALDSMSRAIPGHPSIFLASARVRAAQGELPEAEKQIRAYLAATPDTPRRQGIGEMTLARILWSTGRLDEGDAALERGIAWQLRLGDTIMALRESLAEATVRVWLRGDRAGAVARLDQALRRFPIDRIAPEDQPLAELATLQALVSRLDESDATLARLTSTVPEAMRRRNAGAIALATMTQAIARGDVAAARAAHRRYLETPATMRSDPLDVLHERWVSERLGRR